MRVEPIIYFECLMLCLVILIVLFIANIRYWRPVIFNRLSLIYVFTAITIGFYAARTFMEGHPEYALINKLLVVGSSLFMTLSCMFYYYYVLKNVGVTYKNGKFWYLSSVLAILGSTALNVVSIWTNTSFSINSEGFYQNELPIIPNIASYAYVVCGVIFAIVNAIKAELMSERHKYATLALAVLPTLAFGIFNSVIAYPYGLPTVFFGVIISLLIVFASSSAGKVTRDPLTKLLNRFSFDTLLIQAIKKKDQDVDLFLYILDINGFKGINDTFGHSVGDEVLIRISKTLEDVCEEYKATVARWGGDEFVVYLETKDDEIASKLLTALKTRILTECNTDERFTVSISGGYSKLREFETMKHLFDEADHKLYEDKKKFHRLNQ